MWPQSVHNSAYLSFYISRVYLLFTCMHVYLSCAIHKYLLSLFRICESGPFVSLPPSKCVCVCGVCVCVCVCVGCVRVFFVWVCGWVWVWVCACFFLCVFVCACVHAHMIV